MFSINSMRQSQIINLDNPPVQAKVLHVNIAGYSEHDEYIISSWGGENEPDPFNFIFPKLAHLLTQCEVNSYQYERLVKELPETVRRTFREWTSVSDSSVFDNVAAQEFRGYLDDERTNHINKRNFKALLETVGQDQLFLKKTHKITQN